MRRRRLARLRLLAPATLAAAVMLLAACGGTASGSMLSPSASATASAGAGGVSGGVSTNEVIIAGLAFAPQTITVNAGATVTWTNKDPMPHDVSSADGPGTGASVTDLFSSGTLDQGQTFSYTFADPGTYYYECRIHASQPAMHATVIVK